MSAKPPIAEENVTDAASAALQEEMQEDITVQEDAAAAGAVRGVQDASEIPEEAAPQEVQEQDPLETCQQELEETRNRLLRAVAETENMRRRFQREKEDMGKYAITGFAKGLVDVLENLNRALQAADEEHRQDNAPLRALYEGVEMTHRELLRVFEQQGIVRIDPVGDPFNHQYHQAVAQVDTAEVASGHVVDVVQAGYVIHDRLLRPAMVTVAKPPAATAQNAEEAS